MIFIEIIIDCLDERGNFLKAGEKISVADSVYWQRKIMDGVVKLAIIKKGAKE